jgi:predicted TIM-barrel fold metal-dependent hydrolase
MINNKFFAIDSHCHVYPEKIASRAVGGTDNFYGVHSAYDGTVEALLVTGINAGIDRFVIQSVATTPKQVSSINRFIAETVIKYPDKMTGLGTLHPDGECIENDVEELIALNLHGVKLHPDIQQFKIDDYRCLKIYELCEKHNLPVLMHTGDNRYDFSNPNRLLPVLDIYKNLTVIGAHFGGWSIWEQAANKLSNIDNFYVDCSSSFAYLDTDTIKRIIDKYGAEKILFGTDYPMWPLEKEIETLLSLNLSDQEYELIFHKNAEKLFVK